MVGYRSVKSAYDYLLSLDANTDIHLYTIRWLCYQQKIKFIKINTKYLIHMGSLLEYLGLDNDNNKNQGVGKWKTK